MRRRGEVTVKEAAQRARLSNISTLISRGKIRSRKDGGRRWVSRASLDRYVNRQTSVDLSFRRAQARLRRDVLRDMTRVKREVLATLRTL